MKDTREYGVNIILLKKIVKENIIRRKEKKNKIQLSYCLKTFMRNFLQSPQHFSPHVERIMRAFKDKLILLLKKTILQKKKYKEEVKKTKSKLSPQLLTQPPPLSL